MARKARPWTCRRKSCKNVNPVGTRKCQKCGKARPAKKIPAHKKVLRDLSYDDFILLNDGERCWIHRAMGLPDPPRRGRLHRDHDHRTGKPRGLLCYTCNRWLAPWVTAEFCYAAGDFLTRAKKIAEELDKL